DLLQGRDRRFGAVETEALSAGEFQVAEFFEALGLDQLVEDGALALAGERDFLVGTLDTFLNPELLVAVGQMEEFDAQRLAIGAPQDGDDLAQRTEFESQNVVEKNPPVEIGLAEAVRAGLKLLLALGRFESERIELGVEMTARPVGADQHQGPDRIARWALNLRGRQVDAARLRLLLDLGADRLAGFG